MTAVPIFHRAGVYTAYEYLERRFDAKTRALAGIVFLISRGMAVGLALYAPAIVMSVIFGWPDRLTTLIIGIVCVFYTTMGGIPAVTWTDVLQMTIIFAGLILALITVISLMPHGVSFTDAVYLAGAVGKLNAVDTKLDWDNRYNLWSGLLGSTFLMLGYFGCDQSQVQRYLTGKSVAQSKLSMHVQRGGQGAHAVFHSFRGRDGVRVLSFRAAADAVPANRDEGDRDAAGLLVGAKQVRWRVVETRARRAGAERRAPARRQGGARTLPSPISGPPSGKSKVRASRVFSSTRKSAHESGFNDTNYVFLTFVTRYFPAGVIGLVIAVIMNAAMSSSSGELNSLAAVSVMDLYRRLWQPDETDRHYLIVSRVCTAHLGDLGGRFRAVCEESRLPGGSRSIRSARIFTPCCWVCLSWRSSSRGCGARRPSGPC